MYKVLMLNVDELWLKGKNRPLYFKAMKNHIKKVLSIYHDSKFSLENENQRLVAKSEEVFSEEIIEAFTKVPGLATITLARAVAPEKEAILPAILEEIEKMEVFPRTFKVKCKRAYKLFPHKSMDLQREMGHLVLKEYRDKGLSVDVHNPEMLVDIKVMKDNIYVSTKTIKGTGGLPVGTSGKAVTLISGGFDSPVASYMMSKRGVSQVFAFFYAYPFVGDEVKEKIKTMCQELGKYQKGSKLYVLPFGEIQNLISKQCDEEYRTLLFRKYMIETADLLARKTRSDALIMGDALGQVSSQTMQNMQALDSSVNRIILRPLVGFNKLEIVNLSKIVGTHDISIIPHDDACSLFAPKHPVLRPDWKYWNDFVAKTDIKDQLWKCVENAEVYSIEIDGELTEK